VRRIALTGNIASGKSAVARVWRRRGAAIIDADELARRAVEPGSAALARIVDRFGAEILGDGGALDRAALRAIVFADPAERAALEAIVHPEVARLRRAEEARHAADGAGIVVHEIPLLFEVGLEREFETVVLVDAPDPLRVARLVEQRGIAEAEAKRMVAAQMPAARKRAQATHVLDNAGTLDALERDAAALWDAIAASEA
jgi:dephospho-CoA kinase